MDDKERSTALIELIKAQMQRFDTTRRMQWTFNSLLWSGILIATPIIKNSQFDLEKLKCFGAILLFAYLLIVLLFQQSLEWDKHRFKHYRNEVERIIAYRSPSYRGIIPNGWGLIVWPVAQIVVTVLLLWGAHSYLQT